MSDQKQGGYKIHDPYGTYFVTFTIVGWTDIFTRRECKDIVIDSLKYCQTNKGLIVNAYVIMSSHIHLVLRADKGSDGLSTILRDMKKHIAKQIIAWFQDSPKESRKEWLLNVLAYHAKHTKNKSKFQVWQRGNRPKQLMHPKFTRQKLNYIHYNPVQTGIVDEPEHYRYSSARNYMDRTDGQLDMEIIDFGVEEGYLPM